jgi:hypothetical protein
MRAFRSRMRIFSLLGAVALSGHLSFGQTPSGPAAQPDLVPPPSWLFDDLACAPGLTTETPPALRVLGSQDTVVKNMLGPGDTLVITGGSNAGLQSGQQFFVRRNIKTFGAKGPDNYHPLSVHTAGWVQILGVDSQIATATVVHACDGIMIDDYLEPFTPPMIAARAVPGNSPQYANMGHILTADEAFHGVAYAGALINIDRGSAMGVVLGQRFLVYRDKRDMRNDSPEYSRAIRRYATRIPLVEVGEVLVVGVKPDYATVQVVMAKDAITLGDFIAEIR